MYLHTYNFRYLYNLIYIILFIVIALPADGQNKKQDRIEALKNVVPPAAMQLNDNIISVDKMVSEQWRHKLDPSLRTVVRQSGYLEKRTSLTRGEFSSLPLSTGVTQGGEQSVSVFIQTDGSSTPSAPGLEIVTQVGDIVVARLPVNSLESLARDPGVRFIDASLKRAPLNNAGRTDIGAHKVHQGENLPAQYRGEGVVVGVIDSGIDFTHPDFSDNNGTRIQYLVEYTKNGVLEWPKAQIDANPGAVTQRDLDDGHGHGTHVTGSAAGGGRVNADMMGVAPASDIIFIKGFIDGGFSDEVVVSGTQYIFNKAGEFGKPAVVNLSLGSNFGPLDGTSLYEQALSNLTGPGKIIVAAAGNEGFDLIHAGGQLPASSQNLTLLLPHSDDEAVVNMWYKPGVISQVAVGAFYLEDGQLYYLGNTDFVPAGSFLNYPPLIYTDEDTGEEYTLGYVGIDAQTVNHPQNGDGNALFHIVGDPDEGVNLTDYIWVILYTAGNAGQFNMWSLFGEFYGWELGFDGYNEFPGNTNSTVGSPATAKKVIAVGSYVTKSMWTDIDGLGRQWLNPHPDGQQTVVPQIGQRSYFSSKGPTRDGRIAPDISAPGELIFSPLSSHLTEGQGYQRPLVLQGGQYLGMQGTSMASPHLTGVVALLLQNDPTLTYDKVLEILQSTARSDSHTGSLPNNLFGAGKVEAHAAVASIAEDTGGPGEPTVLRYFDPQSEQKMWTIDRMLPVDSGFVYGTNRYLDKGKATAFTLPAGQTTGEISQVKVWFGYKKDGLTDETYRISVHNGTASAGPSGDPVASRQYLLRDINADATFGTFREPTVHNFSEPVAVGSSFFVGVDFGDYDADDVDRTGIVATDLLGVRVAEVWEQWDTGAWHNISDAWFGQQGASGSGTNGAHMWIEVTLGGTVSVPGDDRLLPATLALEQNYPNPFNPATVIQYSLPEASHISLIVYDVLGREVRTLIDGEMDAGIHRVHFEANDLSSGLYFYRLKTGDRSIVRKMMLIR